MARVTEQPVILSQINYYKPVGMVMNYDSDLPEMTNGSIKVKRGYRDSEGVITAVDYVFATLTPAELAAELAAMTGGGTLYEELQTRMYNLAVSHGAIPADATDLEE